MNEGDLLPGLGRKKSYQFDDFEVDPIRFELRKNNVPVAIEPQNLRILLYMLSRAGELITREELIAHIWRRAAVSDWAVAAAIKAVRIALGDTSQPRSYVQTVHGQGVRFTGPKNALPPTTEPEVSVTSTAMRKILILPFENLTQSVEDEYLAAGIGEDLGTDLIRISWLKIVPRAMSQCVETTSYQAAAAAKKLDASHILRGSLRRMDNKLRINVSLSAASQQHPIWAKRFDGQVEKIFDLQDEINAAVVSAVTGVANGATTLTRNSADAQAYDSYLKGRYEYYSYSPASFAKALAHFEHATQIDPEFADAYAQQSYCRTATHVFAWPGADQTLERAEALARKAIALDENCVLGHVRLGWVLGYLDREAEVIAAFSRAQALGPDNLEVKLAFGETLNRLGRPERALELLEVVFSTDAFLPPSWEFTMGHSLALLGQHDAAITRFSSVLERVPKFMPALVQLARTFTEAGHNAQAAQTVAKISEYAPKYSLSSAQRMFPYPQQSEHDRLREALKGAGMH